MNRQQAKELLPIIQAFAEGKTIQVKGPDNRWYDSDRKDCKLKFDSDPQMYRIKPKYRPFRSKEECWNEMLKHQPFGFVKHKTEDIYSFICKVDKHSCYFAVNEYWAFDTILKKYSFADGTPFGIKE